MTSPRGEELDERGLAGNGCVGREARSASMASGTHREMTHMADGEMERWREREGEREEWAFESTGTDFPC